MDVSKAIRDYLIATCDFEDTWYHIVLAVILLVPVALTFIFFGISYYTRQIFYLIMSLALFFDFLLNYFLTAFFLEPSPMPSCGGHKALPSFQTQHSSFLFSFIVFSRFFFYLKVADRDLFWLHVWILLTWVASIELGYNSFKQALMGAVIGHAFGFVAVVVIALVMARLREYMVTRGILHFFGYRDDIFDVDEQVVVHRSDMLVLASIFVDQENKPTYSTAERISHYWARIAETFKIPHGFELEKTK